MALNRDGVEADKPLTEAEYLKAKAAQEERRNAIEAEVVEKPKVISKPKPKDE